MATKHSNGSSRAVLYLRMSSAKQDKSIADQRTELTSYAKRKGYTIVREYVDSAISGDDTDKRSGFLRMRDDCSSGSFDVVLCWDQDRFGRFDLLDAGHWIMPFRESGIRLETIAQGRIDWEDLVGQLIYSVNQMGKAQFLRDLSRNVTRGHVNAAKREKRHGTGGRAPDGYLDGEEVRLDPERAPIILRLFKEYLKPRASLRSVAETLNKAGLRTHSGKSWCQLTVRNALRNRKYTGAYVRFRYRTGNYNAQDNGEIVSRSKSDPDEILEPIVFEGNHESIVSPELFEEVQTKLLKRRRETAPRTGHQYAFSGILRCGDCGGVMRGSNNRGARYVCHTFCTKGKSTCFSNSIAESALLGVVARKIREQYLSEKAISRFRKVLEKELDQKPQTDPAEEKRLRTRIAKLEQQIDTGAERVFTAPESLVPKLYQKLDGLREERDRLEQQLNAQGRPQGLSNKERDRTISKALDALESLSETFSKASPKEVRALISSIVSRVELHYSHDTSGKRTKNTLEHGRIFVRPPVACCNMLQTSGSRLCIRDWRSRWEIAGVYRYSATAQISIVCSRSICRLNIA